VLRPRDRIGKYRIEKLIGEGGFANVYQARDTIEGVGVALKIPHADHISKSTLDNFRKEVRLTAPLDHPNILTIKNATFIGGQFLIVYPLANTTLHERLKRRLATRLALDYAEQLLRGLAYAHEQHIVHCDVKPENLLLFENDRLRLADFGIAKVAYRTLRAAGTGTLGYVAPEQAFGRPSLRSDVFSAGMVLVQMFAGTVPEWPFSWPFRGHERMARRLHPDMLAVLRRACAVDAKDRYPDARAMLRAFERAKRSTLAFLTRTTKRKKVRSATGPRQADWQLLRRRHFQREYARLLGTRYECGRCKGPVSEAMQHCPWCGTARKAHRGPVDFPARCPRCKRGVKTDWRYCPWCHGASIGPLSSRAWSDRRYEGRCASARCDRKQLMPWMRYCPWCHTKVRRPWKGHGLKGSCKRCGWGLAGDYWDYCPWCGSRAR